MFKIIIINLLKCINFKDRQRIYSFLFGFQTDSQSVVRERVILTGSTYKKRLIFQSLDLFREMGNSSKDGSVADGGASRGDSQPSETFLYTEGEKVLAFHGPRLYEAKARPPLIFFPFSEFFFVFFVSSWMNL